MVSIGQGCGRISSLWLFQLLATGLRHCLLAEKPSMLGNSDVGQVDENRRMLTECVYHILTASSYGEERARSSAVVPF